MDIQAATPVLSTLQRAGDVVESVVSPQPEHNRRRPSVDRLADAVDAHAELSGIRKERNWLGRMSRHLVPAVAIGGLGLGAKFGLGASLAGADVGWSSAGGAALGAGGAAAATIWAGLADRLSQKTRRDQAQTQLNDLTPELRSHLRDPEIRRKIHAYSSARHLPLQLAEIGATAGSLVGGAAGLATGPKTGEVVNVFGHPTGLHEGQTQLAGRLGLGLGVAGLGAGLLAGYLRRRQARREAAQELGKVASMTPQDLWIKVAGLPAQPATNEPRERHDLGGNPRSSSNKRRVLGLAPVNRYSAGHLVKQAMMRRLDQEPETAWCKTALDHSQLRRRAEVIIRSDKGVLAIDKGDYLLFPGGGQDLGETPEQAVQREAIEEADQKLLNLEPFALTSAQWPKAGAMRDDVHEGERTRFFIAEAGGPVGTEHPDREDFDWISFDRAETILAKLIRDERWDVNQNMVRLAAVRFSQDEQDLRPHSEDTNNAP